MTNTSFLINNINQSLLASIYCHLLGVYIPLSFYQNHNTDAGEMLSTIEDLSKYAQIHLNNGTYQKTTILGEETLQLMHEPHFTTLSIKDTYNNGRKYRLGWIIWSKESVHVTNRYQGHY